MSKHMKRLAVPRSWSVPKKEKKWATKPRAGPHPTERSLPLLMVVRDQLGYADTNREAKRIIGAAEVHVDGKPTRDHKRPVGFMDVVSFPKINENYRMLFDKKGKLRLVKIDKAHAKWKLARIENKSTVKGGKLQLNLHDGKNILVEKNEYKTGDVLKLSLPSQDIMASYELGRGNIAMVIGGKHSGEVSIITEYTVTQTSQDNPVEFKDGFSTGKSHVFVIGKKTPEIKLPEEKVT